MRKFFQRLDNSSKNTAQSDYQRENLGHSGNNVGLSGTHSGGNFIGKVFQIGQYNCTVEDIIAEGGFALVFLVKAQGNLGRFALKRLFVNSVQDLENAKNEIEIAMKLRSHKNIVSLVESRINVCGHGVYEIFLLMDHCKGHLLQRMNDKLKDGSRFTEPEILDIFCDLCEAVAKIHQLEPPVIHRDLKIENILINENGTYQVCDFGSATSKILSASSPDQSALEIEEEIKRYTTLSYRAPEMIDVYCGKPITTKSDIWAMGCCLYKMCFFQMPFGESTLAIQNAQLTIPDDKFGDYSTKLLSLIAYMLVPDPDSRPDIFQVSQLAFKLNNKKCPIVNIKAKVIVPEWQDMKIPLTDSQAREIRRSVSGHNLTALNSGITVTDSGLMIDTKTTSVTPRQRPKTSITLTSTLPTSPVAFTAGNTTNNRATTPCDLTSTVNTLTSVTAGQKSESQAQNITVIIPPPPQQQQQQQQPPSSSSSSSTSSQTKNEQSGDKFVASAAAAAAVQQSTPTQPSAVTVSSTKKDESPKFSPANDPSSGGGGNGNGGLTSTNPFLEHNDLVNIPAQLSPSQSLRNLSIQHDSTSVYHESSSPSSSSSSAAAAMHQHRRNLSDTSAFSHKNMKTFECDSNRLNSYSLQSSVNISQPVSCPNSGTRSLNPFIDNNANVASFEDQQFGHEFDRIRQENSFHTTGLLIDDHDNSTSVSTVPHSSTTESIMAFTNNYDPFEAKNTVYPTPGTGTGSLKTSAAGSIELQRPSAITSKPKQNTIIQITSGNAFIVQNDTQNSGHIIRPSPSSAFVAVVGGGGGGGPGGSASGPIKSASVIATATTAAASTAAASTSASVSEQIAQQMKHLTLAAPTDKSISSSSQGQETNLTQAANYMPLYSSEESEKSSSDSDSDSDLSDDTAAPIAESVHLGDDVLDNLIHESSNDLTKPLVDENDDDEYEEDDEDEDDDDDSSIGSASDLQHSSSESNNTSSNTDDYDSDDLNSSKSSQSRSDNSLSDQGKAEELNGFVIIPAHHPHHHHHRHQHLHHHSHTHHHTQIRAEQTHHKLLTTVGRAVGTVNSIQNTGQNSIDAGSVYPSKPTLLSSSKVSSTMPGTVSSSVLSAADSTVKASPIMNQLEISATNTDGDGTSCSEILSTTSSMNLSAKVTQDSTNVTIDQLIGHIDANRPLLEEDDDPEDDPESVRPMIEIDREIEYIPPATQSQQQQHQQIPATSATVQVLHQPIAITQPSQQQSQHSSIPLDTILNTDTGPIDMFGSMTSSTHSVIMAQSIGPKDFDVISSTDSEENRRLDEEVEMSLTKQVLMDQMNRKDLFGSVPFTDKELVDKSIEQQNKIALQKTLSLERSVAMPKAPQNGQNQGANNTDLFGAVPFNSTEKLTSIAPPVITTASQADQTLKSIKLDPPPQVGTCSMIKHSQTFTTGPPGLVSSTATKPAALGGITVSNISSKPNPSKVVPAPAPVHVSPKEPKSPIPSLKSVGKIKTKTARKYEVDESDEEVDGLLEPQQDEETEIVVKKKTKKDAKKEKTDKKSKEKEDKKERKNREKLEKELKKKKQKSSTNDEKISSKHCEGQQVDINNSKTDTNPAEIKPESKSRSMLRAELKVLKVRKDKKSKVSVQQPGEFGSKVAEQSGASVDPVSVEPKSSGLLASTPIKQSGVVPDVAAATAVDDPKLSEKESKKKKDKKMKVKKDKKSDKIKSTKKHQAFANMSFEDETTSLSSSNQPTSIGSPTAAASTTGGGGAVVGSPISEQSKNSPAKATVTVMSPSATATIFSLHRTASTGVPSIGVLTNDPTIHSKGGTGVGPSQNNTAGDCGLSTNSANVTITRC